MHNQLRHLLTIILFSTLSAAAIAQETVTIFFDNSGAEAGVTPSGTSTFSFMGANWEGGSVVTLFNPPLYASGSFSYIVQGGSASVTFDVPVTNVRFFFVQSGGANTATALAADGSVLGTANSNPPTTPGDPNNFVEISSTQLIDSIEFSGGVIDNFSFTIGAAAEPFDFALAEGAWQNLDTTGEGILFDFSASLDLLFGAWFTFTLQPVPPADPPEMDIGFAGQRWMTMLLTLDGNTASGPLRARVAGAFDMPPTASETGVVVGEVSIQFVECDLAIVDYTIDNAGGVSGSFEIVPTEQVINPDGFSCGGTATN